MRVAALYDIHGNLPALEAVLEEVRELKIDGIVVGGDVLPGPMPRETVDCLLQLDVPVQFIHGNGDREVLARMRGGDNASIPAQFRETIRWTAEQLGAEHERLVASWPATLSMNNVLFCHATPRNDIEIFTRLTPDAPLLPVFENAGSSLVVCGHTHMQFDRTIGSVRVVNAGSVGMPFGNPGAYWLLLGPDVELRKTTYDLEAAAERIRQTNYPQAEEFATRNVLRPPSEADMLALFSKSELKG